MLNFKITTGVQEIHIWARGYEMASNIKTNKYTKYIFHALKISGIFHPSEFLSSLGNVIVVAFGGILRVEVVYPFQI